MGCLGFEKTRVRSKKKIKRLLAFQIQDIINLTNNHNYIDSAVKLHIPGQGIKLYEY